MLNCSNIGNAKEDREHSCWEHCGGQGGQGGLLETLRRMGRTSAGSIEEGGEYFCWEHFGQGALRRTGSISARVEYTDLMSLFPTQCASKGVERN